MMKERIKECALSSGFLDVGFLRAEIFSEISDSMKKNIPFSPAPYDERINPFLLMDNAKSIIVLLASYNTGLSGNMSSYAMGEDYHTVLEDLAKPILELLEKSGAKARFFCDNAVLNERFLAKKAGLGFIGKNGFLISPKFGSFVLLAHIITDLHLDPDKPLFMTCKDCGKCISACPTGAVKSGDFYSCLSYITQKKDKLSPEEETLIFENGYCWGCDICQKVCPHNINAPKTTIPEFSQNLITDLEIPEISNREFKRLYAKRAFSWRGKGVLDRNLTIVNNSDKK